MRRAHGDKLDPSRAAAVSRRRRSSGLNRTTTIAARISPFGSFGRPTLGFLLMGVSVQRELFTSYVYFVDGREFSLYIYRHEQEEQVRRE